MHAESLITVTYREVDSSMSDKTDVLLPFYLGYKGGNTTEAIQCLTAGSNGYEENHLAYNGGLNNHWAKNNTPWSWGYYKRNELPVQFSIAESWTSADMYQVNTVRDSIAPGFVTDFASLGKCHCGNKSESSCPR